MNIPLPQRIINNIAPQNQRLRSVIAGLVVLATLAIAYLAGRLINSPNPNTARLIPLALLGLSAAVIGLLVWYKLGRIEYGILFMALAGGMLNFLAIGTGTESRLVISLVVALVLVAVWVLRAMFLGVPFLRPSAMNTPVLAFLLVNVIAFGWFFAMRDELMPVQERFIVVQLGALAVNLLLPIVMLFTISTVRDVKWFRWLVGLLLFLAALNAVTKLWSLPTEALISNGSKGMFVMWGGCFAYAQLVLNHELSLRKKVLMASILFGVGYYYFFRASLWLSGWLPLLVAISVVTFFHSRKLFLLLCLGFLILLFFRFDVLYNRIYVANAEEGGLGRLDIWAMNLRHVANHPIFGMGPAGYAPYNIYYHPVDARSTHNNYFDILAQTGVVGITLFVWILVRLVRIGLANQRLFARKRNFEDMFATATLAGTVACIVGMALGDWVLPFAYNQTIAGFDNAMYTWLLWGCMVSMALSSRRIAFLKSSNYSG